MRSIRGRSVRRYCANAAGLFRLINEICSLRIDAEALVTAVGHLVQHPTAPERVADELTGLVGLVQSADKALLDLQTRAVDLAAAPSPTSLQRSLNSSAMCPAVPGKRCASKSWETTTPSTGRSSNDCLTPFDTS